jgi:hypothetical protein
MQNEIFYDRRGIARGLNLALTLATNAKTLKDLRDRLRRASAIASTLQRDANFDGGMLAEIKKQLHEQTKGR